MPESQKMPESPQVSDNLGMAHTLKLSGMSEFQDSYIDMEHPELNTKSPEISQEVESSFVVNILTPFHRFDEF